ncbi:hypothetical protein ATCC90586_009744 [Pythium insidiosum]|nr:hypothetical protein ATCC90586_009744 [Pythium insidiosum]
MPPKSCRHVSQALRLADLRRSLRHHDALQCEACNAPAPRGNSRSKASRRGHQESPTTADVSGLASSGVSVSPSTTSTASPTTDSPDTTLQGWSPSPQWNDLCICVTCGFMGCMSRNHFMQHFQTHSKHFVGFLVGAKVFWCCSCRREIDDDSGKTADALQGCVSTFEEIADKQQRRVRSRQLLPSSARSQDEALDSQRSYVSDIDTSSSRSGITVSDLETATPTAPSTIKEIKPKDKTPAAVAPTAGKPEPRAATSPGVPSTDVSLRSMGVLGFSNLGNTCYFNAATQALLTSLHCFPDLIHEDSVIERIATGPIAATLMLLSQSIQRKTSQPVVAVADPAEKEVVARKRGARSPKPPPKKTASAPVLTVAPLLSAVRKKFSQFRGFHQQDAHELLTSVLWSMDEEMDPPVSNEPSTTDGSTQDAAENGHQEQSASDDGLVNVFVKTDTGDTISMRVPPTTTPDELRAMLAKKLQLDDRDVYLQPKAGQRQAVTLRRRSSAADGTASRQFSRINFVRALFGGSLLTQVTCKACGHCSSTAEDAFQLSVPIPEGSSKSGLLSLQDCLERFTHPTELLVRAENGYDCDKCSRPAEAKGVQLRDASMQLCVAQLPRVLVVHLKRLSRVKKITQHIQFDALLDMAPFVRSDAGATMFELVAVVVHKGNKRAGHYVAYVSRQRRLNSAASRTATTADDEPASEDAERGATLTTTTRSTLLGLDDPDRDWFYVSDSLVQPVGFDQVLKCEAYMLFYQQLTV